MPDPDLHGSAHNTCGIRSTDYYVKVLLRRDVCEEGFDLTDTADAVFLDLPHPWKVVPHSKTAMKVCQNKIQNIDLTCSDFLRYRYLYEKEPYKKGLP